jgi:hypothetical protein
MYKAHPENIVKITYKKFHGIDIDADTSQILNIDWICDFAENLEKQIVNWNVKKSVVDISYLDDYIFNNIFIAKKIRSSILKNQTYNKISYSNDKYGSINILFTNNNKNISDLEKYIMNIIQTFYEYSSEKNIVNIVVILTDFTKCLPENEEEILTNHNVNSGMSDSKNIVIWRTEEIKKVLIHELIHHYHLDFGFQICSGSSECSKNEMKLYKNYKLKNKNKIIINEAITETLAMIINCLTNNNDNLIKSLVYETWHSFIQVSKILNHFGFKKIDEFLGISQTDKVWIESTNVFSYYMIKSIMLFNLPKIIPLLNLKNKRNINNYNLLLEQIKVTDIYIEIINWLLQLKINDLSLRMSYY